MTSVGLTVWLHRFREWLLAAPERTEQFGAGTHVLLVVEDDGTGRCVTWSERKDDCKAMRGWSTAFVLPHLSVVPFTTHYGWNKRSWSFINRAPFSQSIMRQLEVSFELASESERTSPMEVWTRGEVEAQKRRMGPTMEDQVPTTLFKRQVGFLSDWLLPGEGVVVVKSVAQALEQGVTPTDSMIAQVDAIASRQRDVLRGDMKLIKNPPPDEILPPIDLRKCVRDCSPDEIRAVIDRRRMLASPAPWVPPARPDDAIEIDAEDEDALADFA